MKAARTPVDLDVPALARGFSAESLESNDDLPEPLTLAAQDPRFRALFDTEFAFVWRTLRRMGVADASLDDATQRVFMVLAQKIDKVQASRERSFLFGVCRRTASRFRRGDRPCSSIDEHHDTLADRAPPLEDLVEQKRARELLDLVLGSMSSDLCDVLILHEGEGMTVTEIASTLDIARGTAASRLRRARETFDDVLARLRARQMRGDRT